MKWKTCQSQKLDFTGSTPVSATSQYGETEDAAVLETAIHTGVKVQILLLAPALMLKSADRTDLKSVVVRRLGSNPSWGTWEHAFTLL